MNASAILPKSGFTVTHYLTVADVDRASEFYVRVFDAEVQLRGSPTVLKLANAWLILNVGGGPTDDKPDTRLEPPKDLGTASGFMNIRVADIADCYALWRRRGATFITEPKHHGKEIRCYLHDLDGYLIEVGQSVTDPDERQIEPDRQIPCFDCPVPPRRPAVKCMPLAGS